MKNRELPGITRVQVHSAVLSRSGRGPAALVSVQPTSTRGHFMQVYLADLLSPVLGDDVYSYRAKMIMNVMTKVGHERAPHVQREVGVTCYIIFTTSLEILSSLSIRIRGPGSRTFHSLSLN